MIYSHFMLMCIFKTVNITIQRIPPNHDTLCAFVFVLMSAVRLGNRVTWEERSRDLSEGNGSWDKCGCRGWRKTINICKYIWFARCTMRPKERAISRSNIWSCPFEEHESSGKLCPTEILFFFSIIIYNSKYFVPHRPVTVRIRAAAKRPLKPLAAPLKMLQWNVPAAASAELRKQRSKTRRSRLW